MLNGMEHSVQGVWGSNLGSELNFSITIQECVSQEGEGSRFEQLLESEGIEGCRRLKSK